MKINLTVTAPALIDMIKEIRSKGLAASDSEAVNVLLRELYDCRQRKGQPQIQQEQTEEPKTENREPTERLSF